MVRKYTKQLLQMVEDSVLDPMTLIQDLLGYMSEADVQDFMETHELVDDTTEK